MIFLNKIKKYNINDFLITGVGTGVSILLSAIELFDPGINVLICPESVYSIYGEEEQNGLFIIRTVLGDSGIISYNNLFKFIYEKE